MSKKQTRVNLLNSQLLIWDWNKKNWKEASSKKKRTIKKTLKKLS